VEQSAQDLHNFALIRVPRRDSIVLMLVLAIGSRGTHDDFGTGQSLPTTCRRAGIALSLEVLGRERP
jgi:hypothetical protein